MKNLIFSLIAVLAALCFHLGFVEANQNQTQIKIITPERVFIPQGFDDNDSIEVVVDILLTDSCTSYVDSDVIVDHNTNLVQVVSYVTRDDSLYCADVLIPYFATVKVGVLSQGIYEVRSMKHNGKTGFEGILPVEEAKVKTRDSNLYPNITSVKFMGRTEVKNNVILDISGNIPNTCMHLVEIRTYFANGVIEILPILDKTGGKCQNIDRSFTRRLYLNNIPQDRYLVHVRSKNGKSLNKVYNFGND